MTTREKIEKDIDLLNKSIAHWEEMLDYVPDWKGQLKPTSTACPLCNVYFADDCDGCPVASKAGALQCNKTPYAAAFYAFKDIADLDDDDPQIEDLLPEWHRTAQLEIDFLTELRDRRVAAIDAPIDKEPAS